MSRYIIVGSGWAGQTIAKELIKRVGADAVEGFIDDNWSEKGEVLISGRKIPLLGATKEVISTMKAHNLRDLIIAVPYESENYLLEQIVKCHELGFVVHEMPALYAKLTGKIPIHHVEHRWLLPNLSEVPSNFYTFFHDTISYLLSFLGVLIILPILPLILIFIKLDSKGPLLFKQKREGKNGVVFDLLKFRTMVDNAENIGSKWTLKNDERITRAGKWLRKVRFDELPQLLNVLKGEMSLIGPRPEAVELVQTFKENIPFYEYRYLVKPGITGWAQVNHENTCSVEGALEKLQYDLYWIKHRSIWLDIKIIFKSMKVVLTGFGAV